MNRPKPRNPDDAYFMTRCLQLAEKGAGFVSPNPMVGAVIVKNGKVLAEGYHHRVGGAHAEIDALKKIKFKAKGATLYCNLEPCFHQGRTPPCVHSLIASGISRVVIANKDPNPLVCGRSVKLLKKNKISVTMGVMEKEAAYLNRVFFKWIRTGRPYIILKIAMSLDGKIVPPGKATGWVTGPESLAAVQRMRAQAGAVLVGANTIRQDNPRLNVRGPKNSPQPLRIILDSRLTTPLSAKILRTPGGEVVLATTLNASPKIKKYQKRLARVLSVDRDERGFVSLNQLIRELARIGVPSILVEGGGRVFSSFLNADLADELVFFVAPKIFGDGAYPCFPDAVGKNRHIPFELHSIFPHGQDWEMRLLRNSLK